VASVAPPSAAPRHAGLWDRLRARRAGRRGATVGRDVAIGRNVVFDVTPGARVVLEDGASIGAGSRFHVRAGEVRVGAHTMLGDHCVVVAHERVTIAPGCVLGDEVVVVDFDHRFDDVDRPVREQGIETAPVEVGNGVRVGPGAALLRGVTVGDGARVGAHAVVTKDVPAGATVEGVPAR
jgi:acetyltransferase-like isoleucine patch superfamily enzyme